MDPVIYPVCSCDEVLINPDDLHRGHHNGCDPYLYVSSGSEYDGNESPNTVHESGLDSDFWSDDSEMPDLVPVTEPVSDDEPVTEPVSDDEPVTEPVSDDEPVTEPVSNVEPVTEPVSNVEPVTASRQFANSLIIRDEALHLAFVAMCRRDIA